MGQKTWMRPAKFVRIINLEEYNWNSIKLTQEQLTNQPPNQSTKWFKYSHINLHWFWIMYSEKNCSSTFGMTLMTYTYILEWHEMEWYGIHHSYELSKNKINTILDHTVSLFVVVQSKFSKQTSPCIIPTTLHFVSLSFFLCV